APVRRCEGLVVEGTRRGRGKPKKYWGELHLTEDMALDRKEWRSRIKVEAEGLSEAASLPPRGSGKRAFSAIQGRTRHFTRRDLFQLQPFKGNRAIFSKGYHPKRVNSYSPFVFLPCRVFFAPIYGDVRVEYVFLYVDGFGKPLFISKEKQHIHFVLKSFF
ncbi:hypothetical protein H5410_041145, partial [Solanum commersonii]